MILKKRKKIIIHPGQLELPLDFDALPVEEKKTALAELIGEREHFKDELDFDSGDENGFDNWRNENREKIRKISDEWGVQLFRKVRIKLSFLPSEISGFLILLDIPSGLNRRNPLRLRLNYSGKDFDLGENTSIDFLSTDIESSRLEKK